MLANRLRVGQAMGGGDYTQLVLADSPIRYWPCNGDGTEELIVSDSLSIGGTAGVAGLTGEGEAIQLVNGEAATAGNIASLAFPLTIEFLINTDLLGYTYLHTNYGVSDYRGAWVVVRSDGKINLRTGRSGASASQYRYDMETVEGVVTPGNDTHIVAHFNAYNDASVIVNGQVVTVEYSSGTSPSASFGTSGVVGVKTETGASSIIDEIAIYDYLLPLANAQAHSSAAGIGV